MAVRQEISLYDLFMNFWNKRLFILKVTIPFVVLGLIHALTAPKEWKAANQLLIKNSADISLPGSLGGLAGLAGVNVGQGSGDGLNPLVYEDLLFSNDLIQKLFKKNFYYRQVQDSITFGDYFDNHHSQSPFAAVLQVPGIIISWIKGDQEEEDGVHPAMGLDYLILTESEELKYKEVRSRIIVEYDEQKALLRIGMITQDAYLSAQVTNFLKDYLQAFIFKYSTSTEQLKLDFIEEQLAEKEARFFKAQEVLAEFRDSNLAISTRAGRSEEERLETDYNLALTLYSNLSQNYEDALLALQEKIPTIESVGPVKIPARKDKPKRLLILIAAGMLGVVFSCMYLLLIWKIKELRSEMAGRNG